MFKVEIEFDINQQADLNSFIDALKAYEMDILYQFRHAGTGNVTKDKLKISSMLAGICKEWEYFSALRKEDQMKRGERKG